jgi:hypothetical protein
MNSADGVKLGDRISAAARRSVDTGKTAIIKSADGWCAVIGRGYGPIMMTPRVYFSSNMVLACVLAEMRSEGLFLFSGRPPAP